MSDSETLQWQVPPGARVYDAEGVEVEDVNAFDGVQHLDVFDGARLAGCVYRTVYRRAKADKVPERRAHRRNGEAVKAIFPVPWLLGLKASLAVQMDGQRCRTAGGLLVSLPYAARQAGLPLKWLERHVKWQEAGDDRSILALLVPPPRVKTIRSPNRLKTWALFKTDAARIGPEVRRLAGLAPPAGYLSGGKLGRMLGLGLADAFASLERLRKAGRVRAAPVVREEKGVAGPPDRPRRPVTKFRLRWWYHKDDALSLLRPKGKCPAFREGADAVIDRILAAGAVLAGQGKKQAREAGWPPDGKAFRQAMRARGVACIPWPRPGAPWYWRKPGQLLPGQSAPAQTEPPAAGATPFPKSKGGRPRSKRTQDIGKAAYELYYLQKRSGPAVVRLLEQQFGKNPADDEPHVKLYAQRYAKRQTPPLPIPSRK
jgi:hypothetical protein